MPHTISRAPCSPDRAFSPDTCTSASSLAVQRRDSDAFVPLDDALDPAAPRGASTHDRRPVALDRPDTPVTNPACEHTPSFDRIRRAYLASCLLLAHVTVAGDVDRGDLQRGRTLAGGSRQGRLLKRLVRTDPARTAHEAGAQMPVLVRLPWINT